MSYSGWLIKIGDYKIPLKYIKAESYSAYVNMQDLEDYTDANGYLHRNALELKAFKIEFETPALLNNKDFKQLMSNIRDNFTVKKARQCLITAYIPEYDDYVTQTGYMADFQPQMYHAQGEKDLTGAQIKKPIIQYNSIRLAFIGGVYNG